MMTRVRDKRGSEGLIGLRFEPKTRLGYDSHGMYIYPLDEPLIGAGTALACVLLFILSCHVVECSFLEACPAPINHPRAGQFPFLHEAPSGPGRAAYATLVVYICPTSSSRRP